MAAAGSTEPDAGRWELIRALGAALATPPPGNGSVLDALGLPRQRGAEHTAVFVLSAPPHAAIHLGPEGKLGGEGLDRVAGFWRAMELRPPEDADHLGVLLMLYAELAGAADAATTEAARARLAHARQVLLAEHLGSWAPGYLAAVVDHGIAPVTAWAELTAEVLAAELAAAPAGPELPAALREAPGPVTGDEPRDELLDALVAPVRTGLILTRPDLDACARATGLGLRRGERRYALKAMLEQDPRTTLGWLATHAQRWADRHAAGGGAAASWWAERAAATAAVLAGSAEPVGADR